MGSDIQDYLDSRKRRSGVGSNVTRAMQKLEYKTGSKCIQGLTHLIPPPSLPISELQGLSYPHYIYLPEYNKSFSMQIAPIVYAQDRVD